MLAHEAHLEAGVATVDVTPTDPVVMGGYGGRDGRYTGVHDPLLATALVIDDGATRVGLVSVDLLNVSRELSARVRRSLAASHGLDEVILAASHTHAGPYVPVRAFDISPALMADEDVSTAASEIEAGIVEALEDAASDRERARISTGRATVEGVAENRRAKGGVSGNVRIPQGEVDPEVRTAFVELANGKSAVVYNFACHPVCGSGANTELSADWPGYARERIQSELSEAEVLFLNGAAGDINPGTTDGAGREDGQFAFMERVGTTVGEGVLEAIANGSHTIDSAPIRIGVEETRFPLKRTPDVDSLRAHVEDLREELAMLREQGDDRGALEVRCRVQHATETLAVAEWDATNLPSRLTYLELGDLAFLGMPGEVHVGYGLAFKQQAEADCLMPIGYADDYVGYLPELEDLANVGYEVRTMKVSPDALIEFREGASRLISS